MARDWAVVREEPGQMEANASAQQLRRAGFRARAMFDVATSRWQTCVSPPSRVQSARQEIGPSNSSGRTESGADPREEEL